MVIQEFITTLRIDVKSRTMFDESTKKQRATLAQWISTPIEGDWRYKKVMRRYVLSAIFGKPLESQTELDKGEHSALIELFSKVGSDIVTIIQKHIENEPSREPSDLFEWLHPGANLPNMPKATSSIVPSYRHARSSYNKSRRDEVERGSEEQYQLTF